MKDVAYFNNLGADHLPGHLGIFITEVKVGEVRAEMTARKSLMAPNGYLHAGSVISLADTLCGYGCVASLPKGAKGFTTIEIKSNHMSTVKDGVVACVAKAVHLGRSTQVWDATVTQKETGKVLCLFRCTQMILSKIVR